MRPGRKFFCALERYIFGEMLLGNCEMVFPLERCSAGKGEITFGYCNKTFLLERGSAGQGGRGDSDLPPYAPLDPLYPLQTAEGYPRTPPCTGRGTSPCFSTDRVRIGHAIWFGLGPATNRVPGRARTLHGTLAAARTAAGGLCRSGTLPTLQGYTGAQTPGEGSAAPKATVALPGTDVNPAGRAPARLAVHCILATGGPGAAMRHAPFGRPRHPLGTFPCGKVPRPPAGGRNLSQVTGFL